MNRNYTLIGLISFILGFVLTFPLSGLIWLTLYNKSRFGVALGPITIFSFESLLMLVFFLIFVGSAAYFYFNGIPTLESVLARFKRSSNQPTQQSPPTSNQSPPTLGA